jgi:sulfur transfer complex TusBCD TusB component (DsrH family)
MTDLTEANLKDAITAIQKHMEETGKSIALKPTKVMYRPADLEAIGLTHEDVLKMIKENT